MRATELVLVAILIGIVAAVGGPGYAAMKDRAREASLRANMRHLQFAIEDYSVQNGGLYPESAGELPLLFANPYTQESGAGQSWEDRERMGDAPSAVRGIASYADSLRAVYNVKGYGTQAAIDFVLTAGE